MQHSLCVEKIKRKFKHAIKLIINASLSRMCGLYIPLVTYRIVTQ